jgi:hypothetical protein
VELQNRSGCTNVLAEEQLNSCGQLWCYRTGAAVLMYWRKQRLNEYREENKDYRKGRDKIN